MGLYIGTASASQAHKESRINHAITQLAAAIALQHIKGAFPNTPLLDIKFLLPGKLEKVPFKGMQMGGYDHENRTLFFECAVPEKMINSPKAEEYIEAVIEDVVSNAADYFNDIAVQFDAIAWTDSIHDLLGTS